MGRQRQVWLIPIADERVGVQVMNVSEVMFHEEALYLVYVPLPLRNIIERLNFEFSSIPFQYNQTTLAVQEQRRYLLTSPTKTSVKPSHGLP